MFEVPRYLIYQKTMPGGVRLPKRKPLQVARAIEPIRSVAPQLALDLLGEAPDQIIHRANGKMGFTHEEFRFWCLCEGGKQAVCRCCGSCFITENPRRHHLKDKGCSTATTNAYKLLLRDSRCVVCDSKTTHEKWGVPICLGKCLHIYMFKTPTPDALFHAYHVL